MAGRTIAQDKRTKAKKQADFLIKLVEVVSVTKAAMSAKVSRRTIYDWIKNDPTFKEKYDEAVELATMKLEDEAVRRAFEGTLKPVYQGGKLVGKIREYSDTLLIILLKAKAPDKYKDRSTSELTGTLNVKQITGMKIEE